MALDKIKTSFGSSVDDIASYFLTWRCQIESIKGKVSRAISLLISRT